MIDFDFLLEKLGGFGRYQIVVLFSLTYYEIPGALNLIAPVFVAYTPFYRCKMDPFDNMTLYPNLTNGIILNMTTPLDETGKPIDGCVRYGYNLTECAVENDLSCVNKSDSTIRCDEGYHYDKSLFSETVVTEFDLVCNRTIWNSVGTSAYMAGVFVGALIFGNVTDRFGRKYPTMVAGYGMLLSMLMTAYSHTMELFIISRFLVAIFSCGTNVGVFCHIMENVGATKWRSFVGVTYHIGFAIGYMLWSGIAYLYRDWHQMLLGTLVVSAPLGLILVVVPESARWLFAKGRNEQGKKVVSIIARFNGVELTDSLWNEAEKSEERVEEVVEEKDSKRYSTFDLFRSPGLRILTIKVGFYWFVSNMVYYGVVYSAGSFAGNIFLNNIYASLLEIASSLFCLFTMDYIGRRLLLAIMLSGSGVMLIATAVVNEYAGEDQALLTLGVVFAFIAKGLISGSTSVLYNFTVEIFPTVVRANGIGFGSMCARIGGISCPFVLEFHGHAPWIPNSVFGVFAFVGGLVALSFRDTTDTAMMETIEEVEQFIAGEDLLTKKKMKGILNVGYGNARVDGTGDEDGS